MKILLFMLNKEIFITIIAFIFLSSCGVHKYNLTGKMFTLDKHKAFNFFLFGENLVFMQSFKNDTTAYHVRGNLLQIDNHTYLTTNEELESALVNSNLNKIKLTKEQKEKIKTLLINDTIKFNKNFNELNYNGVIYKKN